MKIILSKKNQKEVLNFGWNIAILFQWHCVCEHNMYLAENVWPNQFSARQFKSIISVAEIQSGKHDFMNADSPSNVPVSMDIVVETNQTNSHISFMKKKADKTKIFLFLLSLHISKLALLYQALLRCL